MPGRNYTSSNYRYGFNGKESDNEVKGIGNALDFGARILDPRLGRWMSIDPQGAKYPFSSPYSAFGNNPNVFIDPGGETLKVAGSEAAKAKFKTMIEKQFAGKITAQYSDFGVLHANINEGATLTKSEMALFEQVMYKGITDVGVITGSDELRVGKNEVRTTENVIVGAFGQDIQILDLDDIEMFDNVGKTSDGLGSTTAGSLGHEIAEANKWQQEGKALTEEYQSSGYAAKVAHEFGISVENKINGTERDTDENLPSANIKGAQQLGKDKGSTNFGTMNLYYKTNTGTTKVSYDFNRDNVKNEAPKSTKVE